MLVLVLVLMKLVLVALVVGAGAGAGAGTSAMFDVRDMLALVGYEEQLKSLLMPTIWCCQRCGVMQLARRVALATNEQTYSRCLSVLLCSMEMQSTSFARVRGAESNT